MPDGWLGVLCRNNLFYDFSASDKFDDEWSKLHAKLKELNRSGRHSFIFIFSLFINFAHSVIVTIIAETVQNNNRHWRRPTQVLKHLRVALKHRHKTISIKS